MQTFIVITLVTGASVWLGLKLFKSFFSKETKCEGCAFSKSSQLTEK